MIKGFILCLFLGVIYTSIDVIAELKMNKKQRKMFEEEIGRLN